MKNFNINTILRAINSICQFNCYLNFSEENNPITNINNKNVRDLLEKQINYFISSFKKNEIGRVFNAVAEPLSNPQKDF